MQSISPEIVFRGNDAWEKALPQITRLIKRPLILGRSSQTNDLRNKISKDLKDLNLSVFSSNLSRTPARSSLEASSSSSPFSLTFI